MSYTICEFPIVAVTNSYQASGLKWYKFILLHFWRLEAHKSKYQQVCVPVVAPDVKPFLCLF